MSILACSAARRIGLLSLAASLALTGMPAALGAAEAPLPTLGFERLEPGRMVVEPGFEAAS